MTVSGTNICLLGTQYAAEMNKDLPNGGQIAYLGGTPATPSRRRGRRARTKALNKNIKVVATANTSWTRQGALQATSAIISKYPKLNGISYDYGDATVGVIAHSRRRTGRWRTSSSPTTRTRTRSCVSTSR